MKKVELEFTEEEWGKLETLAKHRGRTVNECLRGFARAIEPHAFKGGAFAWRHPSNRQSTEHGVTPIAPLFQVKVCNGVTLVSGKMPREKIAYLQRLGFHVLSLDFGGEG